MNYFHQFAPRVVVLLVPTVAALYDSNQLLAYLASALWADSPAGALPPPTPTDYKTLGVGPAALVTEALAKMRSRPDAWELLARTQPHLAPEPRTRDFVNLQVRPLLNIAQPRYRLAIDALQRVTRLPRRPT